MNLSLSDEQVFLREAARGALSRFKTFEAAREALDGGDESALPDLWPTAKEAGWPGLLIDEAHGGAGLDAFDAMLVLGECGRVLAGVPLLGHLPATRDPERLAECRCVPARGCERRATGCVSALPARLTTSAAVGARTRPRGLERGALPTAGAPDEDGRVPLSGSFAFVPDAPGADRHGGGRAARTTSPSGSRSSATPRVLRSQPVRRYDATRSLGHVSFKDSPAVLLDAPEESLAAPGTSRRR